MKKNWFLKDHSYLFSCVRKIVKIMRLSIFLIVLTSLQAIAINNSAQGRKINVKVENTTVSEVLKLIERESDYFLFYNNKVVDLEEVVTLDLTNKSVIEVLDVLFEGKGVRYTITNKQIVLSKKVDKRSQTDSVLQKSVSGKVTDENGEPLPGVTVILKGSTQGTVTNNDGNYSLANIPGNATLVFSFVGMKSQEITIGSQTVVNITMAVDAFGIEEVIAIGYGTVKKRDLVGSVASIKTEAIAKPAYSSFIEAFQGKASGVYVSKNGIRIRGINSISNNTSPLWVVDGIVSGADISNMDPSDIASVDIQKDAAATAIYGSRGSNGVIIITTKSGNAKKNNLSFEYSTGVSEYTAEMLEQASTETYFDVMDQSILNMVKYQPGRPAFEYDPLQAIYWRTAAAYDENGNPRDFSYFTRDYAMQFDNSLYDAMGRNSRFEKLYVSGNKGFGNEGNVYFSAAYRKDKGNIIGQKSEMIYGRFGANFSPVNNLKLKILSTTKFKTSEDGGRSTGLDRPSWFPIYDDTNDTGFWVPGDNPVATAERELRDSGSKNLSTNINFSAEYTIPQVKGLSLIGSGAVLVGASRSNLWSSKWMNDDHAQEGIAPIGRERKTFGWGATLTGSVNYHRVFGDHDVKGVIGEEQVDGWNSSTSIEAEQLSGSFHEIGNPGLKYAMRSTTSDGSRLSSFGRVSYKYKDKYLLETSFRRDGTSNFNPDRQFATFGAVGLGWIITDEPFFNSEKINFLKLRGSFGQTGNGDVKQYIYVNKYNAKNGYMDEQYSYIEIIGNPNAGWETTDNYDIGIDYGIFNNKVNGSFAYYYKATQDLLLEVPLPESAGVEGGNIIWQNIGDMTNKGFELNIDYTPVKTDVFSWNISYNHTINRNMVESLYPQADLTGAGLFENQWAKTITKTGEKISTFYLAEFAGIDPQKGIPMIYEIDQEVYAATGETVKTGNIIPATALNGSRNRIIQSGKSSMPNWFGGLTNNLRYKDFNLSVLLTYSGDAYFIDRVIDQYKASQHGFYMPADIMEKTWQKPGDVAEYQELLYGGGFYYDSEGNASVTKDNGYDAYTTQSLRNATFLRVKDISLSYNLPKRLTNKLGIQDFRVFGSVTNAFTFSKLPDYIDPEIKIPGNLGGVERYSGFPPRRMYSIGVSVNLN